MIIKPFDFYALKPEDFLTLPLDQFIIDISSDSEVDVYREMIKKWHPDKCSHPLAEKVTAKINEIKEYQKASKVAILYRDKSGHAVRTSSGAGLFLIKEGVETLLEYAPGNSVEILKNAIGYLVYLHSVKKAFLINTLSKPVFDHIDKKYLPNGKTIFDTLESEFSKAFRFNFPVYQKKIAAGLYEIAYPEGNSDSEYHSMRSVIKHFKGKVDPKHIAWIISSLMNMNCLFKKILNISYNGLVIDNLLVDVANHEVIPIAGKYYMSKIGQKADIIPAELARYSSSDMTMFDAKSIRKLALDLIGYKSTMELRRSKDIPREMVEWLLLNSPLTPVEEYSNWKKVLEKCFGPPKFIKLSFKEN